MKHKVSSFSDRMFRAFMRLFPFEFRGEFQGEMEGVFREQRADVEQHEGFRGLFRLWWETLTGIFRMAPHEHWEMLRQDGGYALRMMAKQPGFAAIAILTLALGIGSNTAIFSVVYGVLLRPLPYQQGQSLVVLSQAEPGAGQEDIGFSVKELADYRQQNRSLEALVEYHSMSFMLVGHGEPQRVATGVVSPEYFDFLGLKPVLGRFFIPDDDKPGAQHVLVLSYPYWAEHLGRDPNIVGKVFSMNGREITVVGVLPPVPLYPDDNDVYMPSSACPFRMSKGTLENRAGRMLSVFGRLKPGATLPQARADVAMVASRFASAYPETYPTQAKHTAGAESLQTALTRNAKTTLVLLLAATGMVLLIACANVANLTLSRLLRRSRELAMRRALGAGPARLLRQLLTESVIVALAGGALGVLFGWIGLDLLMHFAARFTPRAAEVRLDSTVLLFTAGLAIATGILFGTIPAMSAQRNPVEALQGGTRGSTGGGRQRLRSALIVSQVAVSFTLLAGAGMMLHTLYNLLRVDPGFKPQNVLTMLVDLDWSRYRNEPVKQCDFFNSLLERAQAMPGVLNAGLSILMPLDNAFQFNSRFQIEGRPVPNELERPSADFRVVSPDYFRTIGTPLIRGRFFNSSDGPETAQVAIINQSMARHYWSGGDPVGKRITFNGEQWDTIVGVAADIHEYGLDRPIRDEIFRPFVQNPFRSASVFVRTEGDPMRLARQLTEAVYALDPKQPVARIRTLEQIRDSSVSPARLTASLLMFFAGLALVITAVGLAGVMALSVAQRTQEIGIRMALGATPASVFRMILSQGLGLVVLGMVIGVAGGLGLARLMSTLLFGVGTVDLFTLGGVTALLVGVAALSCFLPARRAAVVDPLVALRCD